MRIVLVALLSVALSACARAQDAPPVWSAAALDDLVAVAENAPAEGLPSETAALEELARFRHLAETDPVAQAQLDVAADALFTSLARSFAQGGADMRRGDPEWRIAAPLEPDFEGLRLARAQGVSPSALLAPLLPRSDEYALLRDELARVSAEPAGMPNEISREERIVRLRANLERWRWLPRDLPERRIEVRIAQFEAHLVMPGQAPRTHAVIVGAQRTPTPSFESQVQSITLNPSWEPPQSIVAELARRFRADPDAAVREGFDVIDERGSVIAPDAVDWSARPFRHRVRQRPGAANALGQLRFDMPNAFAIYLHDTPNRNLFDRRARALSHGCIRVQAPDELVVDVLNSADWTLENLRDAIATGESRTLALNTMIPIYLIYLTATAAADGEVLYASDIYGRDEALIAALDGPDAALVQRPDAGVRTCAG